MLTQMKHGLFGRRYGSFSGKRTNLTQSLTDAIVFVETTTNSLSKIRTWSDTITLTDNVHTHTGLTFAFTDFLDFTDRFSRTWDRSLGDSLSFVDTFNTPFQIQTIFDSLVFSDFLQPLQSFRLAYSDAITFVEVYNRATDKHVTDAITFVETYTATVNPNYAISDRLDFVDNLQYHNPPRYNLTDIMVFGENTGSNIFRVRGLTDSLTLAETFTNALRSASSPLDRLSFQETTSVSVFRAQHPADNLVFVEMFGHGITGTRVVSESFAFNDAFEFSIRTAPRLNDSLDLEDTFRCNVVRNFGFCDCLEFADRISIPIDRSLVDTLSFTDHVDRTGMIDQLTFAEVWGTNIVIGDCCRGNYVNERVLTDALVFTDSIAIVGTRHLTLVDTLVLEDSLMYL